MPKKFDPQDKDALLSPERYRELDPHRVISLIPIRPYHIVADIGCGPGYFAVPLGKHMFDGKLFAIDVQQEMLDATDVALKRIHLTNVELVLAEEGKLPLDDDSLDGALAAFVAHEVDDPKGFLTEIRRCLRNGGWLALLEWHKRKMDDGPPLKSRIDEAKLREMAQDIGFRFTARHSLNDKQYILLMRI